MSNRIAIAVLMLAGGCASAYAPSPDADHPAHPAAEAAPYTPPANPLSADADLLPQPAGAQHDHGRMGPVPAEHGAAAQHEAASTVAPLARVLEAYFTIGDRLAADATDSVPAQAKALLAALEEAEDAPPADDPHFWHMRGDDLKVIRDGAGVLAAGGALADARLAYGRLSDALVRLVEAAGVPAGLDSPVYRMHCGMYRAAPQGGVWLQRGAEARNPYFGPTMLRCAGDPHLLSPQREGASKGQHDHGGHR